MREFSQHTRQDDAPVRAGTLPVQPATLAHTEALRRLAQPAPMES
ncbi:hypothetical protein FHT13_003946 [Xanthomonas arboricola]|nr:hypothetical protein [Xanthomonas arboricola]